MNLVELYCLELNAIIIFECNCLNLNIFGIIFKIFILEGKFVLLFKSFTVFLVLMVPIWYSISFLWFLAPKYADETWAFGPCVAWMQAGLKNYCHFTIEAERVSITLFLAAFHRTHLNWVLAPYFYLFSPPANVLKLLQ